MEDIKQLWANLGRKLWSIIVPPGSPQEYLLELCLSFWDYGAPIVGILILALLLYTGYNAFVAVGAQELLYGVSTVGLLYLVALVLRLEFLLWALQRIIPTLVVVLAVILQPELRRIFVQIGRQSNLYQTQRHSYQDLRVIEDIAQACEILSNSERGALIIFSRENILRHITSTGTVLDAKPSTELIVSLFAYDTPLHDGAVILNRSRLMAAGCILPIDPEETSLLSMKLGTRHRSAMSLARNTDAVILIVSEESGHISLAFDSMMDSHLSRARTVEILRELLLNEHSDSSKWLSRWFRFGSQKAKLIVSLVKYKPKNHQ